MNRINNNAFTLFLCASLSFNAKSQRQQREFIQERLQFYDIKNSVYEENGYNNRFSFFRSVLSEKKVVCVGERTHSDSLSLSIKGSLVKYFTDSLGFSIVLLEEGFLKVEVVKRSLSAQPEKKDSIICELAKTGGYYSFYNNIFSRPEILVMGIDLDKMNVTYVNTIDSLTRNYCSGEIFTVEPYLEFRQMLKYFSKLFETAVKLTLSENKEKLRKLKFNSERTCYLLNEEISKCQDPKAKKSLIVLRMLVQNSPGIIEWYFLDSNKKKTRVSHYNPRDKLMAQTVSVINQMYPDKKTIISATNHHLTRTDKLQDKKLFKNAATLANYLDTIYANHIFWMASTYFTGKIGYNQYKTSVPKRTKGSIECLASKQNIDYAVIPTSQFTEEIFLGTLKSDYCLHWNEIYDCIIYVHTTNGDTYLRCR